MRTRNKEINNIIAKGEKAIGEACKGLKDKEIVYVVGNCGPEHDMLEGIYRNKEDALKAFEEIRVGLLEEAKHMLLWSIEDAKEHLKKGEWFGGKKFDEGNIAYFKDIAENGSDMYKEIISRLSETDPAKIDNYPQETPYIHEEELQ